MKGLSPGKLRVIIALQFAAIALFIGFFIVRPWETTPADGRPELSPPHQKIRTAEISLNPALSWELALAGDEKEEAVAAFVKNGYLYIFGNTNSAGLDFDRPGIFLSVIDTYGLTKGFFIYGGEGEILRAACLCEGGFLLAVEAPSAPKLYMIDFFGSEIKEISGFLNSFESVYEVKFYSEGYLLFSGPSNNLTGIRGLRCSFFTRDFEFLSSRLAVSSYSLIPFESVIISGRAAVVCDAVSSLHTLPAMVEFSQNESPKIQIFMGYPGSVKGLSVYNGEFLLFTAMDGSSLLRVGLNYLVNDRVFLSQLTALNLSSVGQDKPEQLYLAFVDSAVYLIDGKGQRKTTFPAFTPSAALNGRVYAGGLVFYAGIGGVKAYSNEKIVYAADIPEGGQDSFIALDENNMFYIYHTDGDVKIAKLRTV